MKPFKSDTSQRAEWLAASVMALAGAFARGLVQPAVGDGLPFIFAAPITVFAALMWGARAGLAAAIVGLTTALIPGVFPDVRGSESRWSLAWYVMGTCSFCLLVARVNALRYLAVDPDDDFHSPLVRWLNAVLLGAILIPATAFCVIAWWSYDRADSSARVAVLRRADLAYEHAVRTFDVAKRLTREAAALTAGPDSIIRDSEADLRRRLSDMLLGVPSVVNLNVWDASARPLVRSDRPVDPTATIDDRQYFREQRAGDLGFGLSEVLIGRQTGRELMNLTLRRPSPDGRFRGVVALSISPGYFRDYYRSVIADGTDVESVALVRTDGEILARWPPQPAGLSRMPPDSPSLLRVQSGVSGGEFIAPTPGTKDVRVVAFRRLSDLPIYVLVGFSRASMLAGWTRTVDILGAVTLPITLVLVAVTAVARRRVQLEQRAQRELTEQIRLRAASERTALEAQRLETLAALTGGVAHDFNNLLGILSNSLSIHDVRHPEQAAEPQLAAIRRAVQSGIRLTRQLLSFTRRQVLHPEVLTLPTWLPGIYELLRTTLGPQISFECVVESDVAQIEVDPAELELALINLAMNAKHAQPRGGAFRMVATNASTENARQVVISAADTGHGIPPEILAKVTEPFFTTKSRGSGSGLGLSQVSGLMAHAGGMLGIKSEVGVGTTIELIFPAHEAGEAFHSIDQQSPVAQFDGCVLLVEDNEDVAEVTATLLRDLGAEVIHAWNATEALRVLVANGASVRFVLCDVVMPGEMDGIQLALRLRREAPSLPVTLVTGYAENIEAASAAGLDVVQKPVSLMVLKDRLRRALRARQSAT